MQRPLFNITRHNLPGTTTKVSCFLFFFIAIRVCYFKAVNLGLNVQPVEPCCLKRVVFYFIAFAAFMPLIATLFGLLFWFFKFYLTFWTALNSHVNSKCASKIFCCCTGTAEFICLRAALPLKLQKGFVKRKKKQAKKITSHMFVFAQDL